MHIQISEMNLTAEMTTQFEPSKPQNNMKNQREDIKMITEQKITTCHSKTQSQNDTFQSFCPN